MEIDSWYWIWLFPGTFLLHILEETFAGERFYVWVRRISGRAITMRAFLALNGLYFVLMTAAVLILGVDDMPWLLPALGSLVTINGIGHLVGTVAKRVYSPGLVSGILLWLPLGVIALRVSKQHLPILVWWTGIAGGLMASALVMVLAFAVSRSEPA